MQSIILNIRANYNQLGPGEKKIADLILAEPRAILPLTITEFSEKAGCGNATLVRFAKRLGMNGYQEYTQKEVADTLGISQSYISRLEKRILKKLKKEIEKIG